MVIPPGAGEGGGEAQQRRGTQHGHVGGKCHAAQASVPGIYLDQVGNTAIVYQHIHTYTIIYVYIIYIHIYYNICHYM